NSRDQLEHGVARAITALARVRRERLGEANVRLPHRLTPQRFKQTFEPRMRPPGLALGADVERPTSRLDGKIEMRIRPTHAPAAPLRRRWDLPHQQSDPRCRSQIDVPARSGILLRSGRTRGERPGWGVSGPGNPGAAKGGTLRAAAGGRQARSATRRLPAAATARGAS